MRSVPQSASTVQRSHLSSVTIGNRRVLACPPLQSGDGDWNAGQKSWSYHFAPGSRHLALPLSIMDDFEIESDDEDLSFDGRTSTNRNGNNYFNKSKSIPSRSFFTGNNTTDYVDDYNFDFQAVQATKKKPVEIGVSDKYFSKSSKDHTSNDGGSSTSALEKAQSLLDKYSKNSARPVSSKVNEKSKNQAFALKKPSESFDEDDISLNSNEIEITASRKSSRLGSFEQPTSVDPNGSFEGDKVAFGSPLLGSFNRDDEGKKQ